MIYKYKFTQIEAMINHWLSTPAMGYRGVNYAHNPAEILLKPLTDDGANTLLRWMREDIPILQKIPQSDLNIYSKIAGHDKRDYFIAINEFVIPIVDNREKLK